MLGKCKELVKKVPYKAALMFSFALGIAAFGLYRFVSYSPEHTHYHANYAVVINGQQQAFDNFSYYEELTGCSVSTKQKPSNRAHMHEPENTTVHVHDEAVTWGNFFENIGISTGINHIAISDDLYTAADDSITYVLNGKTRRSIAKVEISSADRLLVVVGSETDGEAIDLYETFVPSNAQEFNNSNDPGTCSSNEAHGFTDRLKGIF